MKNKNIRRILCIIGIIIAIIGIIFHFPPLDMIFCIIGGGMTGYFSFDLF